TPGTYLLPAALGRFHAAHPGIALSLRISDTRDIERWVSAGGGGLGGIGDAPLVPRVPADSWVEGERGLIARRRPPRARLPPPLGPGAAAFRSLLLEARA